MGRRRLQTILATTILTVGLSTGSAVAQELGDLTSTVEDTVTSTTDEVTSTVEETADDLLDPVTSPTEDASEEPEEESTPQEEEPTSQDDSSGPISTDLEVDVAPSDDDGSPQLEIDGGVTVGDQTVDVGSATDPIEDAIDPDPEPSGETSSPENETDTSGTRDDSRLGGVLAGGGVHAAGDDTRSADAPEEDSPAPSDSSFAQSFAAFGALNRGGWSGGPTGTMPMRAEEVVPPEVAGALDDPYAEDPQTADREVAELAVQSSGPLGGDDTDALPGLLKAFAAALLAATGFKAKRALEEA